MIHPIQAKTCVEAWIEAATLLTGMPDRCAYNLILDIDCPLQLSDPEKRVVQTVDRFLAGHDADPVATVAATIFPAMLPQHGTCKNENTLETCRLQGFDRLISADSRFRESLPRQVSAGSWRTTIRPRTTGFRDSPCLPDSWFVRMPHTQG